MYDLAGAALPDQATPSVLSILPSNADSSEYRIVTRFSAPGGWNSSPCSDTSVTVTVFATNRSGHWLLENALPRLTETWQHETVGAITYVVDPSLVFDSDRAHRAAAFADSIATMLSLGTLPPITYYVASTVDVACMIQGVERANVIGPVGGFAVQPNRQIFSGNPALGEGYLHELVHVLVAPLMGARSTILATEGVATWLGGTEGKSFTTVERDLAAYLARNPALTLDSIITSDSPRVLEAAEKATGAMLSALIFEQAGLAGLKKFLQAGSTEELRTVLVETLHRPFAATEIEWRKRVLAAAARH